ncbi:hypothetical protein Slin15195_G097150 [Septoria linicola]|uniref:Uncharacterized protein n=1 Tax=Septoria linicola TaxID=215465 RepID=A0A9Q9B4W7_9PEZI|nr:hypothetical protein Slin14017_G060240 [Septoria linicola]USW56396.1 hypothetical protein Slin15195_G097150 [Septoria linicola]
MAKAVSLIPLIILFAVVGGLAFIGYQIFLWSGELTEKGKETMEKKNILFKDGGLHVGVKERSAESTADKTQSVLVNAWQNAELPAYKSRLGWNNTYQDPKKAKTSSPRPGNSRSNSGATSSATSPVAGVPGSNAQHRPGAQRIPSTPGSWS